MTHRVVVTGMGLVTPVGNTLEQAWENISGGVCCITPIEDESMADMPVKLAGQIVDFQPTEYIGRKEARRMDIFCQYAMVAGIKAMQQAGIQGKVDDPGDVGVIVGSGIGGVHTLTTQTLRLDQLGYKKVAPLLIPMMISNMASGNLAIHFGLEGPCESQVTACATGANAIGDAFRMIKHGYAKAMLAGGAEAALCPLGIAGFVALQAISQATDVTRASIPFDAERNGFVMGDGAGIVFLESLEHAQARGANILAEVVGYGATGDAYHLTAPRPDCQGSVRSMQLALQEAGITPKQIGYINAHGTGTDLNDRLETQAIKIVFGEDAYKVPVSSTKSMTGHMLGAAGSAEAIFCIQAIQNSFLPPTANYKVPDPELDLDYVPNVGREASIEYALSNAFGFGGHNATLVIKKYSE